MAISTGGSSKGPHTARLLAHQREVNRKAVTTTNQSIIERPKVVPPEEGVIAKFFKGFRKEG